MHLALLNHQAKRCCCTHMHKFRYLNYQYFDFLNVPTLKRRVSNIILLTDWTKIIFLTAFATRKWSFLYLIIHCLNFHKYLPEDVVFNKSKQGFQWFALLICKQILCILNWKNRLKTIHLSIWVGVWLAKGASIAKDYPEFKGLVNWPALIYGLESARSFICTLNDNNLSDFFCMIVKKKLQDTDVI